MRHQQLDQLGHDRRFVLAFATDDEVLETLLGWSDAYKVRAASFTGIGAFRSATLGYFNLDRRDYERIAIDEQVEVLSLAGNIALADGKPKVHAHVVVGKRDGTAHGGHLLDARVRPTLELVVVESASTLRRTFDGDTGLPLLDPNAGSR